MVHLQSASAVDPTKFPNSYRWDSLVRKHHQQYQRLIDAQTYRLQRVQRGILALPYPKYYNTELLTLHLLKAKQEVGEVDQNEVDLYKNIDPCIATHYNKTFSGSFNIPYIGLGVGAGFFAYSSYFGFTVPTRIVLSVVPIAIDWLWRSSDARNEQKSLDFLRWVVGYRKAKCWAEVNRKQFHSEQLKKVVDNNNLLQLGKQLVSLARK